MKPLSEKKESIEDFFLASIEKPNYKVISVRDLRSSLKELQRKQFVLCEVDEKCKECGEWVKTITVEEKKCWSCILKDIFGKELLE